MDGLPLASLCSRAADFRFLIVERHVLMARSFLTGALLGAVIVAAPQLAQAASAVQVGRPSPAETVGFTVHLPLRNQAQLEQLIRVQSDPRSPEYHHYLTVAQFRANFGPTAATVARAAAALRARGFSVGRQATQSLRVSGSVAAATRTFRTNLATIREASGHVHVASTTAVTVPPELAAVGATLTGFEARIHNHVDSRRVAIGKAPASRFGAYGGYFYDDLKQAYSSPSDQVLDGKGAVVGVLMDSDVLDSDTAAQLNDEKYSAISKKKPLPLIRDYVLGGSPDGVNSGDFAEASIDVQTSQTTAPGAQIYLYDIPSLGDDAILAGLTDVVEYDAVDVLSQSFGGCELGYSKAYNNGIDQGYILNAYDSLYEQGNAEGITFLASSGDEAGLECPTTSYYDHGEPGTFVPSVSEPASDPHVTAVGGTNLETTAPPSPQPKVPVLTSKYVAENEYGDPEVPYDIYGFGTNVSGGYWGSGGGVSSYFFKPWYQYLINTGPVGHRYVPDISMQMGGCPAGIAASCRTTDSYSIYTLDGSLYGFIGTSLSSPEFAGVLALKIEASGGKRMGGVNGYIYELAAAQAQLPASYPAKYYHQGIPGYNGVVHVAAGTTGYTQLVGVGTPYTTNFIGAPQVPVAGNPQTITNP
jgi:subtilase family serine protease